MRFYVFLSLTIAAVTLVTACSILEPNPVVPETIVVEIEDYASTDTPAPTNAPIIEPTRVLPTATSTTPPTRTPTPTLTPTKVSRATATSTLIIQPTATVQSLACTDTTGEFQEFEILAGENELEMQTVIYLPPCYSPTADPYPVLYLLHGVGHDEQTWRDIGIGDVANTLMGKEEIRSFIIVMPRERGGDTFDDLFLENIVPFVDSNFNTNATRNFRALGGMSRGAGWTVQMGLRFPQTFSVLGLHSLAIFYSDESRVEFWLDQIPTDLTQHYYLDIGDRDSLQVSARYMDRILRQRDIDHTYLVIEGGTHTLGYWGDNLDRYLRWYASRFGRNPDEIAPDISR